VSSITGTRDAARLRREIGGIALSLFAVFLTGAIIFQQPPAHGGCMDARGAFGPVGTLLRCGLVSAVGIPAALIIAALAGVHALRLFGRIEERADRSWVVFLAGLVALLPPVIGVALRPAPSVTHPLTGIWGQGVAFYLPRAFGSAGAWIVLALAACALTAATLAWNPIRVLVGHGRPAGVDPLMPQPPDESGAGTVAADAETRRRGRRKRGEQPADGNLPAGTPAAAAERLAPTPEEMPAVDPTLMAPAAAGDAPPAERGGRRRARLTKAEAEAEQVERIAAEIEAADEVGGGVVDEELPPVELLTPPPPRCADTNRRELDAAGAKLMEALRTFRVEGELVGRTTGPTVTQFEVEPAPGVKVRQIANLANDLALAMRAQSIRIVAPIPGRGAVGVEVPNANRELVAFRDLVESRDFQQARAALPIALGKDLEGRPVVADLAKMPHLLIAGATGSGKSVCVNTIITSLVYRHTPRTLRFLMVDPKMVELSVYNTLPHLRHKVITDNRDAAAVLKWAVMEMQERYELLAANGCRNLQDFNRRAQEGAPLKHPKRPNVAFEDLTYTGGILPYIVVVIDEMADLMMTVQGEVETPIAQLAQKARAIGIHLLLATQRPSVNVITGLIKANFPSRIAFRVASQVDSRTIIDGAGAEALLGNGDMLFIPPGKSEAARLQGAFLSGEDTEGLMAWYDARREERRQKAAAQGVLLEETHEAEEDILQKVRDREAEQRALAEGGDEEERGGGADKDALFREAAEVVIQHRQGSTSLLQRRLKIGYGRAARIIDQLHAAGVLGPPDGSKPREILKGIDELDDIAPRG